jgi:hypothetical protein
MLPILGIVDDFCAKIQNFVGFKFKVTSLGVINQNFALYLQIKSLSIRDCVRDSRGNPFVFSLKTKD